MVVHVELISKAGTTELDAGESIIIPSGELVLLVRGADDDQLWLDGRRREFHNTSNGMVLALDLSRSVGYHHLQVSPGLDYWFGTEDAKLRLDGIIEMLSHLANDGLTWSGQLLFSDGSYLRDSHVTYGWLDQHASHLLDGVERVSRYPRKRTAMIHRRTARGGKSIAFGRTMHNLRRRGPDLLEKSNQGLLSVGDDKYLPREIIVRTQIATVDTAANRRAVWLCQQLGRLVDEVLEDVRDSETRRRCIAWSSRIDHVLKHSALRSIVPLTKQSHALAPRAPEELTDSSYSSVYLGALQVFSLVGWSPTGVRQRHYAYVKYSDQIYQAFAAYMIADALGLYPTASALGVTQPAFVGENLELYCGVVPPQHLLRSWRSFTSDDDKLRPDLVLCDTNSRTVLIADAKYRNDGTRASESSRKEIMAYMSAYNMDRIVVCYPPSPSDLLSIHKVSAQGREIVEVTVSPVSGLNVFLREEFPRIVESTATVPPWSGSN